MSVKQLSNGERMDGIYTPILTLNTESVATFITVCYLKKANKTCAREFQAKRKPSMYLHFKQEPQTEKPKQKGLGSLHLVVHIAPIQFDIVYEQTSLLEQYILEN